jgi:hypothetical protein
MPKQNRHIMAAVTLAAALLAWPLAASAYTTFSTNGQQVKWSGDSSTFVVNTSGMPGGALEAIQAAFSTWSGAGAHFTINYGGSSGSTSFGQNNGTCLIDYGKLDAYITDSSDTIALCLYWYDPRSGKVLDSDIRFNSSLPWSTSGDTGSYDVQNIVTHELGHSLVLLDLYGKGDSERTMYGLADKGETKKRSLDGDDINGIRSLYP